MSWLVEDRGDAIVVTMNSNPINKMNPAFFDDLHEAFDALDRDHPGVPAILTAAGRTFSAGLDVEDAFPRFGRGDPDEVTAWFERFRGSLLRVFHAPRRTIAAINGNALAGGLILALCCDVRIAADGPAKFAINEVAVGVPMPASYTEVVRYAIGSPNAAEVILSAAVYPVADARRLGFVHAVVPPEQLLDTALVEARRISADSASAYATSKAILHDPTNQILASRGAELDGEAIRTVMSPDSVRLHAATLERMKGKR